MSLAKIPKELKVSTEITESGFLIKLNQEVFPILYSDYVWQNTSEELKKILLDNISMASTLYLPQILDKKTIVYDHNRPLGESFFLRNGIYDAPYCANVDKKSSIKYLQSFFNTRYLFKEDNILSHQKIDFTPRKNKKALILFSMGKESLLSFALCKELGIETVLATIIHPGFQSEWRHKKNLVKQFEKEFKTEIHIIDYQPGILKEGKHFGLKTELGWGLHVTEYALLALPLAEVYSCDFVVCGNEQSCNDIYFDTEDVLIYRAGLDQHHDWTKQQGLLQSLIIGRSLEAYSFLEPLYEIAETKILHSRYPEIAKYQMSCFSGEESSNGSRWCQKCEKCAYMYALFRGFNLDPKKIGFSKNLFKEEFLHLYDNFFNRTDETHYYGSQGELSVAFCESLQCLPLDSAQIKFSKCLLDNFNQSKKQMYQKYLGIHPTKQMPDKYHEHVLNIFEQELKEFFK